VRTLFAVIAALFITVPASAQLQAPWWDRAPAARVGAYWIKTDLPAEQANELAQHLNVMYEQYSQRLASLPQRAPEALNVLIFKNRRDYELTLRSRFGVDPTGTGGLFFMSNRGNGLALWTEGLPKRRVHHVLQHEGFHQFAHSRFGGDLPIWVNEGLAEFFGEAVIVGRALVIGQSQPRIIDTVSGAIDTDAHIPFVKMLSMSGDEWRNAMRDGDGSLQYAQAWSMVHFLVYGEGGRYTGAFERYLRLLNHGLPSQEAFVRAFGSQDIEGFERKWKSYAQQAQPSAFIAALERAEFLAQGMLAISQGDQRPTSLDELKIAMREAGFSYPLTSHKLNVVLSADDDELFEIPSDELAGEEPARFTLRAPDLRRLSRRQRNLEKQSPTPWTIATEHLQPANIEVVWVRKEDGDGFTYDIVVR
jgi:hypothetical protein